MFNFRISMNKKILALAIPSIISNITVPLLGLVDVTIVGHLGSPLYIGAIAVGGMLFNMIYWLFAFLRMGTSGLTSQAYGKRDLQDVATLFIRAMAVGFGIALLLILLQGPILHIAFSLINTTEDIRALATLYFRICIFGAPAVLGLYTFPDVYCHYTKFSQHHGEPMSGLYLEYGSFRSGIRDSAGSICRFIYGIHVMAPVLQMPMEVY